PTPDWVPADARDCDDRRMDERAAGRDGEPSELYEPGAEPLMRRFRRAVVGEDDENVRAAMSAMKAARPLGYGLIGPEPGPFDAPPPEPVELDPDALPWELRDGEDDASSSE
ncbi:MAG: hypothetical protein QM598_11755, partial [Protaetiibacter sp.]